MIYCTSIWAIYWFWELILHAELYLKASMTPNKTKTTVKLKVGNTNTTGTTSIFLGSK